MSRNVLVSFGGGMRSAYTSSVLYTLATKHGLKDYDLAFSASSGYINTGYFLAGQCELMKDSWLSETKTKNLFNFLNYFRNKPLISLDYLIDDVLRKRKPIVAENLISMKTDLWCPLLDVETAEWDWISNRHPDYDYWQVLRAAMTLPGYTSKGFCEYLGKKYMDAGTVDFRKVKEHLLPGDKLVIVQAGAHQLDNFPLFNMFKRFYPSAYKALPDLLKQESFYEKIFAASRQALAEIEKEHKVLRIVPPVDMMSLWDIRPNRFHRLWSFAEHQLAEEEWQNKIKEFSS